jgi:spermidine/putrescine-binding protein
MKTIKTIANIALLVCGNGIFSAAYAQSNTSNTVNAICSTDQSWCELAAAEYTKATGIKVLQTRKATGEALAQLRAEANNPKPTFGGAARATRFCKPLK